MLNNLTKLLTSSNSSVINSQSTVYNFNNQNNVDIGPVWKNKVTLILKSYFALCYCLISRPVFIFTPNKVTIHLFYYKPKLSSRRLSWMYKSFWYKWYHVGSPDKRRSPKALNSDNGRKLILLHSRFKYIASFLASLLKRNVELEVVRLKYPYHDSEILAQLIGINGKSSTYPKIKKNLFTKASILSKQGHLTERSIKYHNLILNPTKLEDKISIVSKLTGIKIRIAGRLARQRIVPKRTVKTAYKGGIARSENNYVNSSTYTSKNRRGAFSVRVWLSHGI